MDFLRQAAPFLVEAAPFFLIIGLIALSAKNTDNDRLRFIPHVFFAPTLPAFIGTKLLLTTSMIQVTWGIFGLIMGFFSGYFGPLMDTPRFFLQNKKRIKTMGFFETFVVIAFLISLFYLINSICLNDTNNNIANKRFIITKKDVMCKLELYLFSFVFAYLFGEFLVFVRRLFWDPKSAQEFLEK